MSTGENQFWRVRFYANEDDYRPIKWPPPGPFWCSGYGDGRAILIAWVPNKKDLKEYWPEAEVDEWSDFRQPIRFTDRFQQPDWWKP